jgi:hypothetical protein
MPWSWLVDWFTGFGHIVNNATQIADDHLAAQYAYIMLHKTTKSVREISCKLNTVDNYAGTAKTYSTIQVAAHTLQESKTRVPASPFGFNFSLPFSNRQLSILTALGLSRL